MPGVGHTVTDDCCTPERCVCNATGCPYVCDGPTIVSTWPNESRMSSDERAIYAAGLWRDREAILAYARGVSRPVDEIVRLILRFQDHDTRPGLEQLRESFVVTRTRGGIASGQALRTLLAERSKPAWPGLRSNWPLHSYPENGRPPRPWARGCL